MLSLLGLATVVCFLVGVAVILAFTVRAGAGRSDGSIARILYEAEQRETTVRSPRR